eukprot:Seg1357.6 transcript_id=Seg1357.6/GoldUCD/mRNA.D3Y31 product="hypothetical protein" protein_id=Seg1357.6/GoldUCD/D3Y31
MDARRKKKGSPDYYELDTRIKQLYKREKENWYKNMCENIEQLEANHKIREMHENVKKLTNRKKNVRTGSECIKDKNGKILFERENVAKRWEEYITELYEDVNRDDPIEIENEDGPELLKTEIRHAIKMIKGGKAPGADKIMIEHMKALDEEAVDIVLNLCKQIYDTGIIPEDLRHTFSS